MDTKKLLNLAEILESPSASLPEGFETPDLPERFRFDMETWYHPTHPCGTVGCIAGLAWHLWMPHGQEFDPAAVAKDLGLSSVVAFELFHPDALDEGHMITPAQAAQAVRNVVEHDDPRWAEVLSG